MTIAKTNHVPCDRHLRRDPRIEALEGQPIECTAEEWHGGLRTALQTRAGEWADQHQDVRVVMALGQVERLDRIHGAPGFTGPPEIVDAVDITPQVDAATAAEEPTE